MRTLRPGTGLAVALMAAAVATACTGAEDSSGGPPAATTTTVPPPPPPPEGIEPFEGLGAWVDVFDYVPIYAQGEPPVSAGVIDELAARGVDTLYLQVVRDDDRAPVGVAHRTRAAELLIGAHGAGMAVVAWYLPLHVDEDRDVELARRMVDFEVSGHRFDGIALDLEAVRSEPDVAARNQRLVGLARRLREMVPDRPVGAITYSPVQLEVVNTDLWPAFPYRAVAPSVDVWLPMAYWSFRSAPYDDPATYVDETVRRLRANVGDPALPVHVIGGVADAVADEHYGPFLATAERLGAVGVSVYDHVTTSPGGWDALSASSYAVG